MDGKPDVVRQAVTAITLLAADTGKWPNGCPLEAVSNPEVSFTGGQAGIIARPSVGDQGNGCVWTQTEVDAWRGPYMSLVTDPWGSSYYFDPDYHVYENCASQTAGGSVPTVLSFGKNLAGPNAYDCDDIFFRL